MKIKSLLFAAAAFTALSMSAEVTLTANDIEITEDAQCNTMIELSFNLNNPDYPNTGTWAERGWWKNIQIEMLLPDFVKPYLFYDEDEDASYYGKAGASIRKSGGAPVVSFTDNVDFKDPETGEITHNDGPEYVIVGANINAILTGNGEIYVFFVQVPKEAKANLVNGTYPIKVYSKVVLGDDSSVQIGTPDEKIDLCNVVLDLESISTAVSDVNVEKAVSSVTYYNAAGMASETAFDGINIVVTKYADGSQSTAKVVK